jgi:hypothetical protein
MLHVITLILAAAPPAAPVTAEIVDCGTDKEAYKVGDKATVRIAIKNTGGRDITNVEARAAIEKEFLGKYIKVLSDHIQVPIYTIKPGQTETYKQTSTIPNFPGRYRVSVKVVANGQEIGDFSRVIEVTR